MTLSENTKSYPFDRPGKYRIRVRGLVPESWSERIGGMHISTREKGDQGTVTDLIGTLVDQAELAGVLNTLYEMHLVILLVEYQDEEMKS